MLMNVILIFQQTGVFSPRAFEKAASEPSSLPASPLPPPSEAFTLYEGGIDLLLQGARQEPSEQRRQTLLREANVHMSRAESIKLALDPRHLPSLSPAPAPEPAPAPTPAPPGVRSRGKGKSALSRPVPTASDVRGNLRVRVKNRGAGGLTGTLRCTRTALLLLWFVSYRMKVVCGGGGRGAGFSRA